MKNLKYNIFKSAIVMEEQDYKNIISGQTKGLIASLLRVIFLIASVFYAAAIVLRNFCYSKGCFKCIKVNAPVISVGNITAGGTGKTPLVIWICNFLKQHNFNLAVLTRGYKTQDQTQADEPAEIANSCPDVPVIVNPDRIAGAKQAIEKNNAKVLILDDGFQHRRFYRNLDIVTIDATEPFGFGKLLPAGLLREPISSLKRANAVVFTHSDLVPESELKELEQLVGRSNPNILIFKTIHKPSFLITADGQRFPVNYLKYKHIFVFCGIGNPGTFLQTLENTGSAVNGSEIFDDHHHYSIEDIKSISEKAGQAGSTLVVTTQKDWTKIKNLNFSGAIELPFGYLAIELKIIENEENFRRLILDAVSGKIAGQQKFIKEK